MRFSVITGFNSPSFWRIIMRAAMTGVSLAATRPEHA